MSKLQRDRDKFLQRAQRGIVMSVRFACEDARIACAVPIGRHCNMCSAIGAGHALDQIRGRVGIPSNIRELILSIDSAHGSTGVAPTTRSKRSRTKTRGLDRALACSRSRSTSRAPYYPRQLAHNAADTQNPRQQSTTHSTSPTANTVVHPAVSIQAIASAAASFESTLVERLEEYESALVELRCAHNDLAERQLK